MLSSLGRKNFFLTKPAAVMLDECLAEKMTKKYFLSRSALGCFNRVLEHPKIIGRYLRVAEQLHKMDKLPLVHGQSCGWAIPQRILQALDYQGMECLRLDNDKTDAQKKITQEKLIKKMNSARDLYSISPIAAEIISEIKSFSGIFFNENRFDHDPDNSFHLISATLGGLHCEMTESPLFFVFGGAVYDKLRPVQLGLFPGNHSAMGPIKSELIGTQMIKNAMVTKKCSEKTISAIIEALPDLYDEAFKLPIGQIIVLGIPKEMKKYVYHSRAFGYPTGKNVDLVIDGIVNNNSFDNFPQMRLILTEEVMSSTKISVLNVMDFKQVDEFCPQLNESVMSKRSMNAIFGESLSKAGNFKEERNIVAYQSFVQKIDKLIAEHLSNRERF